LKKNKALTISVVTLLHLIILTLHFVFNIFNLKNYYYEKDHNKKYFGNFLTKDDSIYKAVVLDELQFNKDLDSALKFIKNKLYSTPIPSHEKEALVWEILKNRNEIDKYLYYYPKGKYTNEAYNKLFEFKIMQDSLFLFTKNYFEFINNSNYKDSLILKCLYCNTDTNENYK